MSGIVRLSGCCHCCCCCRYCCCRCRCSFTRSLDGHAFAQAAGFGFDVILFFLLASGCFCSCWCYSCSSAVLVGFTKGRKFVSLLTPFCLSVFILKFFLPLPSLPLSFCSLPPTNQPTCQPINSTPPINLIFNPFPFPPPHPALPHVH